MHKGLEFQITASTVSRIVGDLNTSYGDYCQNYGAMTEAEAAKAIDKLEGILVHYRLLLTSAEAALETYKGAVADGGPEHLRQYYSGL
jgi:hypothetical protein